jgi:hypothetical protein
VPGWISSAGTVLREAVDLGSSVAVRCPSSGTRPASTLTSPRSGSTQSLAVQFSRTVQAIHQFSARNSAEIATRRQVLLGEVDAEAAHLWVADKTTRIAWLQKLIEDLDSHLSDPDLDLRLRSRYTREVASMLKAVAEEKGELPTRVQLDSGSGPLVRSEIVGWDPDKWMAGVMVERGWIPPEAERDGASAAEPANLHRA